MTRHFILKKLISSLLIMTAVFHSLTMPGKDITKTTVDVESFTFSVEADYDGTKVFDREYILQKYCTCEYACLDTYTNPYCRSCRISTNNCRGGAYDYMDINLDLEEPLSDAQLEFMTTTNVITMGDSIMEGYGNAFEGTADVLNANYGVNIIKDTSSSGCLLTNFQEPYTVIPNVYTQFYYVEATVDLGDLPDNSFFVIDGGGNDQLWGYSLIPSMTFTEPENGESDLLYSTEFIVRKILEDTNHSVPVIYILPCLFDMEALSAYEPQLELLQSLQQEGVYVIDELGIVCPDDFSDSIHINGDGYDKVTKIISRIVCEHYGIY